MITKIQTITDVITNSSSSVFIMHENDAKYYDNLENTEGCIGISPISLEWIKENSDEVEAICDILEIDPSEVTVWHDCSYVGGWWETPDQEAWDTFIELHKEEIEDKFEDLYWVDIEDHFEDAWDVTNNAYDDAIWSESRH